MEPVGIAIFTLFTLLILVAFLAPQVERRRNRNQ